MITETEKIIHSLAEFHLRVLSESKPHIDQEESVRPAQAGM